MRLRILVLGITSVLALTGAALAHGPATGSVKAAKQKDGAYTTDLRINVNDTPKDVFFKVTNKTGDVQPVVLTDVSTDSDNFKIRWFRNKEDITQEVRGSGYQFNAPANAGKIFRALVKPTVDDPGNMCLVAKARFSDAVDYYGPVRVNSNTACV